MFFHLNRNPTFRLLQVRFSVPGRTLEIMKGVRSEKEALAMWRYDRQGKA
jgi:hypothetical protein